MALAGAIVGVTLGFADFAEGIARAEPPADPHADAIVVLTGGPARIDGALQLLAEHRAGRLLISGVNPNVSSGEIAGTVRRDLRDDLKCCTDLGRRASNTISNAVETRDWVAERGFSSLIVVTSNYHMPRSLAELEGAMPGVELIPFPVPDPQLHLAEWWRDPPTFGLLLKEYGKYLMAKARHVLPAGMQPVMQASATSG